MPTFDVEARFLRDYRALRPEHRLLFHEARRAFIRVLVEWEQAGRLGRPQFPASLGVKAMVNHRGIWEFAWAPDGRCTWEYGVPPQAGKAHIVWRRIGTHAIYDDP